MPSRSYHVRVVSLMPVATSRTTTYDDVRHRLMVRQQDDKAASSLVASTRRSTIALVSYTQNTLHVHV